MATSVAARPLTALPPNFVLPDHVTGERFRHPVLAAAVEKGDPVVTQCKSVHDDYRNGFVSVMKARQNPDPTMTDEGNFIATYKRAEKWVSTCADRTAAARSLANNAVEVIDRDIAKMLDIAEGRYSTEIRSHFLKMEANDRITAARSAIETFDKDTMGAILSGPSYLSGFSDADRAMLRGLFTEKHAAEPTARKRAIELAVAENDATLNSALSALGQLFPKDRRDAITSRMTEAQEARASI